MTKYNSKNRPIQKIEDPFDPNAKISGVSSKPRAKTSPAAKGKRVHKKKKKHTALFIILAIVIVLLAVFAFSALKAKAEVGDLKIKAYELKDELSSSLDAIRAMDADAAEESINDMKKTGGEMSEVLNRPWWKILTVIPGYGSDVQTAGKMLNVLDTATDTVFNPFIEQIRENPFTGLKDERGLNVGLVVSYLDFEDKIDPDLKAMAEQMNNIRFVTMDIDLSEYSEKFTSLSDALSILNEYKDLLRTIFGNGSDRLYLVMAQNSAEIRASGGFPGSMGTIRIEDGYLSVGKFSSVLDFIYSPILPEAGITDKERELFRNMYGSWAHDACYNPHFSKVAHITKTAYDYRNGESLDGVISVTPEVIQNILQITGEEFTLSDGTKVNGSNATKVIQRDIYMNYQGDNSTANANNDYVDELFSETASLALSSMFSGINMENFPHYINLFKTGCEKNTMMIWFADEEEEKVSIASGSSGNLNSDPENPFTGVYYSCPDPGKLGMFVSIDTEISEPRQTSDDRQEYTVTVTLNNYMDEMDIAGVNSTYLLGNYGGAIQGYVYFFAPAGGTVSDFKASNGMTISMSDYEGLELGYNLDLMLNPGEPLTITYKATTAKGVTTPLRIVNTPTVQDFR